MAEISTLDNGGRTAATWYNCRHGKNFAALMAEEDRGASLMIWPEVGHGLPFAITAGIDGEINFQFPGPKGERGKTRHYTAVELVSIFDKVEELEARLDEFEPFLKRLVKFLDV